MEYENKLFFDSYNKKKTLEVYAIKSEKIVIDVSFEIVNRDWVRVNDFKRFYFDLDTAVKMSKELKREIAKIKNLNKNE